MMLKSMGLERRVGLRKNQRNIITSYYLMAPTLLDFGYIDKEQKKKVMDKSLQFYFGSQPPYNVTNSTVFGDILTDRNFLFPLNKALRYHTQFAPTYSYLFDYKAKNSVLGMIGLPIQEREKYDVCHADDISVIVNMSSYIDNYKTTDKDFAVVKLLANLFKNFAAIGEPVYSDDKGNEVRFWKPITDPYNLQFLNINDELRMIPEPIVEKRRIQFWGDLGLEDSRPWKLVKSNHV